MIPTPVLPDVTQIKYALLPIHVPASLDTRAPIATRHFAYRLATTGARVPPRILARVLWGGLTPIVPLLYVLTRVPMEGTAQHQIHVLVLLSGPVRIAAPLSVNRLVKIMELVLLQIHVFALRSGSIMIALCLCVLKDFSSLIPVITKALRVRQNGQLTVLATESNGATGPRNLNAFSCRRLLTLYWFHMERSTGMLLVVRRLLCDA